MPYYLRLTTKLSAKYIQHKLIFKNPSGTSRGIMTERDTWFIVLSDKDNFGVYGIGECGPLQGLSVDYVPGYQDKIQEVCENINLEKTELFKMLDGFPSIKTGLETAFYDFENGGNRNIFPSEFTEGKQGIPINGLVWMGDMPFMKKQLKEKIENGFTCIKIKIGSLDFIEELVFLKFIRQEYGFDFELRLDANGAFTPETAVEKLNRLSEFKIHSVEQPITQGQVEKMAEVCFHSPIPVALDEELIGINPAGQRILLETIKPAYIILKPSLLGGFAECDQWIKTAGDLHVGWWTTSALESNIGLNAIAQFTYSKNVQVPQGLGTGALYTNNFPSPLEVHSGYLRYNSSKSWEVNHIIHV